MLNARLAGEILERSIVRAPFDSLRSLRASSRLVPDAHLAALATEPGLTLCSADGDFARFPGVRWQNPLAADAPL